MKTNPGLDQAIRDFIELGNTRSRLVRLIYVNFDIDKTPEDIIGLFHSALGFVRYTQESLLGAST